MVIWKDVGKEPEKDCDFEKAEKEIYSAETSVSLTRISFVKKAGDLVAGGNPARVAISHKAGSIKTHY